MTASIPSHALDVRVRQSCGLGALALALSLGAPALAQEPIPEAEELVAAGARIGAIRIVRLDIFDPGDPAEDHLPYRLANDLHVVTRERIIRRELLFREGDPYRPRLIEESERNLRTLGVIYHVQIRPVAYHDGVVDLLVSTQDTWTTVPSVRLSRAGGNTTTGFSFSELNFLGCLKTFEVGHLTTVDRSTNELLYSDPRLFGSRFSLRTLYQDSSDGLSRALGLAHPFFSLDTRWAASASGQHLTQTSRLFESGHTLSEFRQTSDSINLSGAFSSGFHDGRVRRYGFGYSYLENRFVQNAGQAGAGVVTLPADQKFSGPVFTFERLVAAFIQATRYNQFERVEDFNLGNDLTLSAQVSLTGFGAERSEVIASLTDSFGVPLSATANLVYAVAASGRAGAGSIANGVLSQTAETYWRVSPGQTLYGRLAYDVGSHLDGQNQFLLGGDSGLRGYPSRQFAGDNRLLLNLEHRIFTDWDILRLVRVGFVAFADAGSAWYASRGERLSRLHSDLGVGARFALTRSSRASITRLDVAYAVDAGRTGSPRFQVLFGTAARF